MYPHTRVSLTSGGHVLQAPFYEPEIDNLIKGTNGFFFSLMHFRGHTRSSQISWITRCHNGVVCAVFVPLT